ncbi:MAG: GAF domain-containing protein [Candidatus Tectomicrobia bacterium]|uniref:GAF domain-containing protein n=1 Tax=Tectimicrobiota bacterium TaxID=2528274 RepID=A0A937W2N0_UNCTE|nr:GAF domain-containing protein [Candidatus Tectomicrobia bacterium]
MADVLGDMGTDCPCVLIAPPEAMAAVRALQSAPDLVCSAWSEPTPPSGLVICGPETPVPALPPGWAGVWARCGLPPGGAWIPLDPAALHDVHALGAALRAADGWRRERVQFSQQARDRAEALTAVNEIGIALSAERDPDRLLDLILTRARHLVAADGGSLYLLEKGDKQPHYLYFAQAQNDSITAPWKASTIPLNPRSVAGMVALRHEVVVIDDVYTLPRDGEIHHDQRFDQRFHYRTRSVVGIPLSTRDGDILGVLQLINRKPRAGVPLAEPTVAHEVVPFSSADVELLRSLASQAAVSLENSRLYEERQQLFEDFVQATIKAIEQRDPTTSGHSFRVADGTLALARRVEHITHGLWAGSRFSADELRELRYAALLHDFGKVAVREHVLTKAHKLFDTELAALRGRFMLARAAQRVGRLQHSGSRRRYAIQRTCASVSQPWKSSCNMNWQNSTTCCRRCSWQTSRMSWMKGIIRPWRRFSSACLSISMGPGIRSSQLMKWPGCRYVAAHSPRMNGRQLRSTWCTVSISCKRFPGLRIWHVCLNSPDGITRNLTAVAIQRD